MEADIGKIESITRTFIIPKVWAITPNIDIINAIIPQQKPLINPEIILLYCGNDLWAQTIITGWASIVIKPIRANIIIDNIGIVLYVNANDNISGNVPHIER